MDARKRILLVDDDVLVLKTIERLLTSNGYDVITARDGEQALSALEKEHVDLILSDIRMPRLDGIDALRKFRQSEEQEIGQKPVILITAYASEEAPIDAIKLGAKDYILKPFDLDELLESIKKHIG